MTAVAPLSPRLPSPAVAAACRHAAATYPDECCGFIRRSGAVHLAENAHHPGSSGAPELRGRSKDRAFTIAGRDLYALNASFGSADPATCIFHSHPDAGAYFSEADIAEALYCGQPKYPVEHMVISVIGGAPVQVALFRWDGTAFRCTGREPVRDETYFPPASEGKRL